MNIDLVSKDGTTTPLTTDDTGSFSHTIAYTDSGSYAYYVIFNGDAKYAGVASADKIQVDVT